MLQLEIFLEVFTVFLTSQLELGFGLLNLVSSIIAIRLHGLTSDCHKATQFPWANVIGTDLSPIQPEL